MCSTRTRSQWNPGWDSGLANGLVNDVPVEFIWPVRTTRSGDLTEPDPKQTEGRARSERLPAHKNGHLRNHSSIRIIIETRVGGTQERGGMKTCATGEAACQGPIWQERRTRLRPSGQHPLKDKCGAAAPTTGQGPGWPGVGQIASAKPAGSAQSHHEERVACDCPTAQRPDDAFPFR